MALRTAMKASRAAKKAGKAAKKAKQDPKPKFKADRKLDKEIEERLAKQDKIAKDADKAKAKGDKPKAAPKSRTGRAFEQTAAEKAADKAPKDTRVARAGGNVTNAQKKAIADAPSVQALTSVRTKLVNDVAKLKNATEAEKKERVAKIRKLVEDRKEAIRKKAADAAKPKKPDTRPARKKPQSAKERQDSAVGKALTPRRAPANDKKPSMAMMTSYTSMERGAAIEKAGRDLRAGKITQAQHDAIVAAIDAKNRAEVNVMSRKTAQRNRDRAQFKGYDPSKSLPFVKGGVVKGKPRTGHTDMRMGGIFYK